MRVRIAREAKTGADALPIAIVRRVPDMMSRADAAKVVAQLREIDGRFRTDHGVRLGAVIIDTVAAAFGLEDENDNSEASKATRMMKALGEALGVVVIPVHHYGKSAGTGLRGASAWRGNTDTVLSVLAERNQVTGEVSGRELALAKSRVTDEGPIAPFDLEFRKIGEDEDGDAIGSCFIVPRLGEPSVHAVAPKVERMARSVRIFVDAFEEAVSEVGEDQHVGGDGPKVRAVRLSSVRSRFRARYVTGETDKKKAGSAERVAFSRALQSVQGAGIGTGRWGGEEWAWRFREAEKGSA